jgi:hypothetical protein
MTNGLLSDLPHRFAELDAEESDPLSHFISVVERITSGDRAASRVSAEEADNFARRSRLLSHLAEVVPEIVTGPFRYDSQYWVGSEKPRHLPRGELTPKEAAFIRVSEANTKTPSTKPFGVGLFTSTGNIFLSPHGMWRLYLDGWGTAGHVWAIDINVRPVVREITTAAEWVDFVLAHPRREGELLFPDWMAVARHYDAIHMTLRAIASVQGLSFLTEHGTVAPTYWDVESTLWLRWCFGSARLVEIVEADRGAQEGRASSLVIQYRPEPTSAWIPLPSSRPEEDVDS